LRKRSEREKGLEERRDGTELDLSPCIGRVNFYLNHHDQHKEREEALIHGDRCERDMQATLRVWQEQANLLCPPSGDSGRAQCGVTVVKANFVANGH